MRSDTGTPLPDPWKTTGLVRNQTYTFYPQGGVGAEEVTGRVVAMTTKKTNLFEIVVDKGKEGSVTITNASHPSWR